MFRTAELGQKVSKSEYQDRVPLLRTRLLEVQGALRNADFPVLVLFAGVDGAGKGETANLLSEWMDPRWIVTRAFSEPSEEEAERPEYWRYWRDLPPKGHIGIFLSAWYSNPLLANVYGESSADHLHDQLGRIIAFERTLANDGALILKFWMHLGKAAQKRRLKTLESDPLRSWRVTKKDWDHWRLYDRFVETAEHMIMRTSTGQAPWTIVEGQDPRYRSLRVASVLLEALERRTAALSRTPVEAVEAGSDGPSEPKDAALDILTPATVTSSLDMGKALSKDEYRRRLEGGQARLNLLYRQARDAKLSTVLVFEGADAAGKGGSIRRLTAALDARDYQVIPIAAPTDEERAHHYLWRFWRHLPRAGRVLIFDRSWYGRVLVERVEGFASAREWRRAYAEINDFERQLVDHGTVLLKFWLHITPEEQEQRFNARLETPHKRWKMTEEDWRNREKWADYELAVHDMVEHTSTGIAPWILVEGNDKRFARVKVLEAVCAQLERSLPDAPAETAGKKPARKRKKRK
ncbi:MAG: polyphosphate:AMP phosphotransferase [Planctomycetota bacterium]|jgi:polyphosphate:AMP phosphotransferase